MKSDSLALSCRAGQEPVLRRVISRKRRYMHFVLPSVNQKACPNDRSGIASIPTCREVARSMKHSEFSSQFDHKLRGSYEWSRFYRSGVVLAILPVS